MRKNTENKGRREENTRDIRPIEVNLTVVGTSFSFFLPRDSDNLSDLIPPAAYREGEGVQQQREESAYHRASLAKERMRQKEQQQEGEEGEQTEKEEMKERQRKMKLQQQEQQQQKEQRRRRKQQQRVGLSLDGRSQQCR